MKTLRHKLIENLPKVIPKQLSQESNSGHLAPEFILLTITLFNLMMKYRKLL